MGVLYEGALGSSVHMVNYAYNNRGLKSAQSGRYGPLTSYGYDAVGRLSSMAHDVAGSASDTSYAFGHNPAGQMTSRTLSNDAYVWTGAYNVSRAYAVNGLNQYLSAGSATFGYDANGNLTSDGSNAYVYDIENRLVSASGATSASLRYDPLGRLYEVAGASGTTRFLYGCSTTDYYLFFIEIFGIIHVVNCQILTAYLTFHFFSNFL